jgi:hypothetical protein
MRQNGTPRRGQASTLLRISRRTDKVPDSQAVLCYREQPSDEDGTDKVPDSQEHTYDGITHEHFTSSNAVHYMLSADSSAYGA